MSRHDPAAGLVRILILCLALGIAYTAAYWHGKTVREGKEPGHRITYTPDGAYVWINPVALPEGAELVEIFMGGRHALLPLGAGPFPHGDEARLLVHVNNDTVGETVTRQQM